MFKTNQGVVENSTSVVYLRPETAQGMFVDFKQVARAYRKKLPLVILRRLVSPSVMKLLQVTLSSVHVNLNRWKWNSSASQVQMMSGSHIGVTSAWIGL